MYKDIKVIAFDADDTVCVNETQFREAEHEFSKLLSNYETENKIDQELFKKDIANLKYYRDGIKGVVLSLIECALGLSKNKTSPRKVGKSITIRKKMLDKPIEIRKGIEQVMETGQNGEK